MIETATTIHYTPRNTTYHVLQHNINIRTESGWTQGCLYSPIIPNIGHSGVPTKTYVRPYEMFDMNKWEVLK